MPRCAYRCTIEADCRPPSFCSACIGVPLCACQLAQVCRRSCQRKSSIVRFLEAQRIDVLNVAGASERRAPGTQANVQAVVALVLDAHAGGSRD